MIFLIVCFLWISTSSVPPTFKPSKSPTKLPTKLPSRLPIKSPTNRPYFVQIISPIKLPTKIPVPSPTITVHTQSPYFEYQFSTLTLNSVKTTLGQSICILGSSECMLTRCVGSTKLFGFVFSAPTNGNFTFTTNVTETLCEDTVMYIQPNTCIDDLPNLALAEYTMNMDFNETVKLWIGSVNNWCSASTQIGLKVIV